MIKNETGLCPECKTPTWQWWRETCIKQLWKNRKERGIKTSRTLTRKFIDEYVRILPVAEYFFEEKIKYHEGEPYLEKCPVCPNDSTHNRTEYFMCNSFAHELNTWVNCDYCGEGGDTVTDLIGLMIKSRKDEDIERFLLDIACIGWYGEGKVRNDTQKKESL